MARFTIYSKEGNSIRHSGEPKYNGTYLNVPYVEFRSIESPTLINWEVGDFVDYYRTGFRYRLYSLPEPKKQARANSYGAAFVYSNVKFYEATKDLEIALFRDLVPEDNKIHFSTRPDVTTFENVYGIAERIQECMDDLFPGKWRIEVYSTDDGDLKALFEEAKEFSVSNGSCLDALSQIYETWKNVGWVHTYDASSDVDVITIGATSVRTESNTTDAFSYGMGNGLTSIKKAAANEGEFATRLYVYGSERNIQTRYYNNFNIVDKDSVNIVNLMIPMDKWGKTNGMPDARKAYLQADDAVIAKYGLIPRIVYFDGSENEEIYPSIQGLTCREVRKAMIEAGQSGSAYLPADIDDSIDVVANLSVLLDAGDKESIEKERTFRMDINQVGFDIAEQGKLTSEGYATIAMKSGKCEGREFKVKKSVLSSEGQSLTLERAWDESLGMGFPNTIYPIEIGDKFVLLDIPMPDYYISLASKRLYDAGERLLEDYTRVSAFYEPGINPIKIKEGGKIIRQGMYMRIYDEDIIETSDHTDYVLIDTLTIDEASEIPLYSATLREQKRSARTFGTLEEMIEDAKESAKNDIRRERAYTERRFRSAQETAELLQDAFENFSASITPATVQTMQLLLGDESLQFRFTESRESLTPVPCEIVYDPATKQVSFPGVSLIHLTLGIKTITAMEVEDASMYKSWDVNARFSEILEDAEPRYVYIEAYKNGKTANFILSETHKEMDDPESEFYYFLVGILNSENAGTRDFVPLYGFTEILPGQISTDVIRSADGKTYFDLANGKISGKIHFDAGSSGLENVMGDINVGAQNMLRNSGFTGDYLSERIADEMVLDATSELFNPPLAHWDTGEYPAIGASVQESEVSASGFEVVLKNGSIYQTLINNVIQGESYVLSFKAKGESLSFSVGGIEESVALTDTWEKYTFKIVATTTDNIFGFINADCVLCEPQLERGTVATSWGNSPFDNTSDRAYYQAVRYLTDALKGSTTIAGGLVFTSLIMVGDTADEQSGNVEACLNGSDFGYDEEHRKLILAAGIPEGTDALDERARNARTRLYENGFFKTIKAEFEQAKVLGSSRSPFVQGAVMIDGEIEDNHYNFDKSAGYGIDLPSDIGQSGRVMTYVGTFYFFCTDSYIYDRGKVYGGSTPMYTGHLSDYKAHELVSLMAVTVSEDKVAWIVTNRRPWGKSDYCDVNHHGMVAGFRPKCVVLNDGETYNCTSYDHTLISNSAGTYTNVIVLPSNPQDGQEIKIWKNNDHLLEVKTSDGRMITRLNKLESTVHGIEKLFFGTLDLVYHSSIDGWLMIIHETY